MKTFETLLEDLKVTKLSWKNSIDGWSIRVNDRLDHDMLTRLQDRTGIPLKILRDKIYKGISYTIKKAEKGFFKDTASTVGIVYKISGFKLILNVFSDKKITLVTVLSGDMPFHNLIKWELNEFKQNIFNAECNLNECTVIDGFLFEPSDDKKSIEVFNLYEVLTFDMKE